MDDFAIGAVGMACRDDEGVSSIVEQPDGAERIGGIVADNGRPGITEGAECCLVLDGRSATGSVETLCHREPACLRDLEYDAGRRAS